MALPYATENQLKQVTKSEVTKAINPILATGSIRKKPYVEKVVESLSSDSLELLRETLNTNKDNVNVSLVGGSNLLKKFEKEYVGKLLTGNKIKGDIYFNGGAFLNCNDWANYIKGLKGYSTNYINGCIILNLPEETDNLVLGYFGDPDVAGKIRGVCIGLVNEGEGFNFTSTYFYVESEEDFNYLVNVQQSVSSLLTYNGKGWYVNDSSYTNPIEDINNIVLQSLDMNVNPAIGLSELFVLSSVPFKTNTQLIGHIPQVGDVVEKVYFNPNAYSTDSEWMLWYEGLKGYKNYLGDIISKYVTFWKWKSNNDVNDDFVLDKYVLSGVGTLTDILALSVLNNALVYVSNDALTGSQSAVYQQFGVTETGWYKADMSAMTFTKITDIVELTGSLGNVVIVKEDEYDDKVVYEVNNHLFAKVVSYGETFTETPIQNLLKPNPIQVGQEVSKIYINLGYFDNDLNKMYSYAKNTKRLFTMGNIEIFANAPAFAQDSVHTCFFSLSNNYAVAYLSQKMVTETGLAQDNVNKWALVEEYDIDQYRVLEIIDTNVYEYEIQGTITELGDTSLISFNKPFTEIGGYIYEDVTPVTLELEKDLNQDGILIWDDTQCVLLAYYPYKNLIDIFVIDPEDYTYEKLSESATIEELRRVVFTPTQEDTALNINNLSLEEDEVIFDKVFKSSDLENSGKTLLVEDNVKLFDINTVYKAQTKLASELQTVYAKPINELEIEFNAAITQAQGDITEIKLWVELSNDLSHYVISSLAILNTLSASDATVQTQVFNFFKFAMDSKEATLPIKLTKMKYVSK